MLLNARVFAPKKLAPYMLHLVMVLAVAIYVVVGALAVRKIEAKAKQGSLESSGDSRRIVRNSAEKLHFDRRRPDMLRSRRCVISALHLIMDQTNCEKRTIDRLALRHLDDCYLDDIDFAVWTEKRRRSAGVRTATASGSAKISVEKNDEEIWSFTDSVLFCFTVITTIGYGNVAPQTNNGRLFVIMYGLFGVPFTMLAIANLGKFLAELLKIWTRPFIDLTKHLQKIDDSADTEDEMDDAALNDEAEEDKPMETTGEAIMLFFTFFIYIVLGSMIISTYEPEMDFFMAIYFNFVTLTTIGLGDLVPKSETYLIFTLLYCTVGLALTTIAIEIAADYLKRLHYFGRKMDNVGNVQIWFGGQKLTMRQLVRNLGDQFNVPVEQLQNLNLENFVDNAMKVEAGELATLRIPEKRYANDYLRCIDSASVVYVDADELLANPCAQYPLTKLNSRSVSPLLMVSEHAPCGPTPPPIPEEEECSLSTTRSLSLNSVSVIRIRDKPETILADLPWAETNNDNSIRLSPSSSDASLRQKRNGASRSVRRDYSDEARKRYEEYQKQWKKFRTTQGDAL